MERQTKSPAGLGAIAADGKLVFLPLDSVSIDAFILDVSALVTMTQGYRTRFSNGRLTDARYIFPIPEGASVCAFKMELSDGSTVSGVVKDTEKAKKVFQDAVSQGEWAGLAYEITADVFAISVGAIPAGQHVKVEISYATTVPDDESDLLNQIRFAIPTFIGKQRYGAAPRELSQGLSSHDKATLSLKATVQLTSRIIGITSPSHEVDVEPSRRIQSRPAPLYGTTVKLRNPARFDRDVVLSIQAEKLDAPRCVAEVDETARTVALSLTIVPRFAAPTVQSQEYIFVVDRSGSMGVDGRIEYARDALGHLVKSLPTENTSFNIVSFGSDHSSLWDTCVAYDWNSVQQAEKHIATMSANMGGTEVGQVLQWVFNNRGGSRNTAVIVLTDGDAQQVISLVTHAVQSAAAQSSALRVFCLGIGDGAAPALCEGIARAGNGVCFMTTRNESIKDRSSRLLLAAQTRPRGSASEITIDWGYNSAPPRIPNLYPGNRFLVSAILTNTVAVPEKVRLSGRLPDGSSVRLPSVRVSHTVARMEDGRPPLLHTLAAHRIVRTLEDGDLDAFGLSDAGDKSLRDEMVQAAVVEYGVRYSLATRFTSFVAVRKAVDDDDDRADEGDLCSCSDPDSDSDTLADSLSDTDSEFYHDGQDYEDAEDADAQEHIEEIAGFEEAVENAEDVDEDVQDEVDEDAEDAEDASAAQLWQLASQMPGGWPMEPPRRPKVTTIPINMINVAPGTAPPPGMNDDQLSFNPALELMGCVQSRHRESLRPHS
ncbi:hypothetical protein C8Q77DRAFT_1055509 [Trametes polyzona]|nr:hypothetical protein C8Q77DRAFT_1055509 [Trametes polyzona]